MTDLLEPEARYSWIEDYLRRQPPRSSVDVLNADFVAAYSADTGAYASPTMYGAFKCKMLGRDLRRMVKAKRLERARTGLDGMGGMGFPTWVWSYYLPGVLK